MAGNIIPAIATTNAIIAGVVVLHAFNILQNNLESCQTVYLRPKPTHRNQLIVPEKFLNPPNPKCYVCSPKPQVCFCCLFLILLANRILFTNCILIYLTCFLGCS